MGKICKFWRAKVTLNRHENGEINRSSFFGIEFGKEMKQKMGCGTALIILSPVLTFDG
jgi:hypothetical protein